MMWIVAPSQVPTDCVSAESTSVAVAGSAPVALITVIESAFALRG